MYAISIHPVYGEVVAKHTGQTTHSRPLDRSFDLPTEIYSRWLELSDSLRRALLIFFDSFFVAIFLFTLRAVLEDTEDTVYIHIYLLFCTIVLCRDHNQIQILQIRICDGLFAPSSIVLTSTFPAVWFSCMILPCYLRENQAKKRATSREFNP